MLLIEELNHDFKRAQNKTKGFVYARFFKTKKGEYGFGDIFLGISVPDQRSLAKKYIDLDFLEIEKLLASKIHEHRLTGVLILVYKYQRADNKLKEKIFNFYLQHLQGINNWDIVDASAHKIIGAYLFAQDNPKQTKNILFKLAQASNFWKRRIAIVATFYFIKQGEYNYTLAIAKLLLKDEQDLIQKAVGWMLRELGKKDEKIAERFLQQYHKEMPRTMLRYALERFSEQKRKKYLLK